MFKILAFLLVAASAYADAEFVPIEKKFVVNNCTSTNIAIGNIGGSDYTFGMGKTEVTLQLNDAGEEFNWEMWQDASFGSLGALNFSTDTNMTVYVDLFNEGSIPSIRSRERQSDVVNWDMLSSGFLFVFTAAVLSLGVRWVRKIIGGDTEEID